MVNMGKMVSITVRLPSELRDKVIDAAKGEGVSLSELVRRIIRRHVEREEAKAKSLRFLKDVTVDLLCKGFDPISLRQMGYNSDVIKAAFAEVKELAEMSEELQRFSSFRERVQAEVCRYCKIIEYPLALLKLEMLERKALEYYLFICTQVLGKLPILEILSRGDELAQYLKLTIFLISFIREMEKKFFNEGILPDEFIMKELGVPFTVLWSSLENPENLIRSLIEQEKKKQ